MKVKFIFVPRLYTDKKSYYPPAHGLLPPLGIAILKSTLEKNNYKVDIDDLDIKVVRYNQKAKKDEQINMDLFDDKCLVKKYFSGDFPELEKEAEKILSMTNIKGYDVIGLSLLGDSNFSVISIAIILAKLIKEKTGAIVIMGGISSPRPFVEVDEFLGKKYIDFIITQSGEEPVHNLLYAIENNKLGKILIENVIANNTKYKPEKNAKRQEFFYPLKDLTFPDFDGLPLDLYRYYADKRTKKKDSVLMLPYIFIRGCLNKCVFCPLSTDKYFSAKKASIIAEELNKLSRKYKTKYFFFINTHINPSFGYVESLYREFKAQDVDILWTDCANFKFLNKNYLAKLKSMGAIRLVYGLESASDQMLKRVNKGITVRKAESLLKESHKLGIWNEIELIPGLPYETEQDIKNTVNFMNRMGKYVNFFHLNRFILMDKSLFQVFPGKYGLANIKPLTNTIYEMQHFTRSFDETNGLKWPDKAKQINISFDVLDSVMRKQQKEKGRYHSNIDMPLLFYLYSKFDDKKYVEDYFKNEKKVLANEN